MTNSNHNSITNETDLMSKLSLNSSSSQRNNSKNNNNSNNNSNKKNSSANTNHHHSESKSNNNSSSSKSTNSNSSKHTSSSIANQTQTQKVRRSHSSSSRKFRNLNLSLFKAGVTQQQIAGYLSLTTIPKYECDPKGFINFVPGLFIHKKVIILNVLGQGTFSKVFEAINISNQSRMAIKVIRNTPRYIAAAKTERHVLMHITQANQRREYCSIHLKAYFEYNKHPCFLFKMYGVSIYQIMRANKFRPFPNCVARSLIYQICHVIQFLHSLGIIYTDLKPENILLVSSRTQRVLLNEKLHFLPLHTKIKLCDFGSAVYEAPREKSKGYKYLIQTRHYRAPEVVLGLPWRRPVDIWSVACVILEFLNGSMVFNTHCSIDHVNQMMIMIGPMPLDLRARASKEKLELLFHSKQHNYSLKMENANRSHTQCQKLGRYFDSQLEEHQLLYDLVSHCLCYRIEDRLTADRLLKHAYFECIQEHIQSFDHIKEYLQLNEENSSSHSGHSSHSHSHSHSHQRSSHSNSQKQKQKQKTSNNNNSDNHRHHNSNSNNNDNNSNHR